MFVGCLRTVIIAIYSQSLSFLKNFSATGWTEIIHCSTFNHMIKCDGILETCC